MRDVLLTHHGQQAPATYNGGTIPIDGIFASPTIQILVGGYFKFGFCPPTNHRGLWINIHYQVAFGHVMPTIITAQARQLKTTDSHIVQHYTTIWSQLIQDHNLLLAQAYCIQQECTYPLIPHLQAKMDSIDSLCQQGMLLANRKCRKLPTGAITWSPLVQKARDLVEIWGLLLKKKEGRRISSCLLSRGMACHHLVFQVQDITITHIIEKKKEALKEYCLLQKSSVTFCQTYLEELAEA